MSYILDALRRADAERERGRVPGLHAQATPVQDSGFTATPQDRSSARPRARQVAWLAIPILAAVGALAWWTWSTSEVATTAAPSSSAPPPPAATPSSDNPQTQAVVVPPSPASPILAPSAPAPAIQAPAPAKQPPDRPGGAPGNTSDPGALPRVADMTPDVRGGLPPLKVSGVTYADNPALRMLILDGQVVQEGQDIVGGLTLESIGPRSAVLNHRGRRWRLSY